MAFTDDAVKAKLSALNETQDSIVTVAQWIMFHRRHADRTAQLWMQRLKESTPSKRLNLVYLANEVVQQSKMRKKTEFVNAYSPIIAEATAAAYKGTSHDLQQKIRRVIEVWRHRQIFDLPIQEAIEKQVDEIDRNRSSGRKPALGGSLFSSSGPAAPAELQPLVTAQTALTRAEVTSKPTVTTANEEYDKLTNPNNSIPTPPVHAARLASLLKNLANAEGAVAESIKARTALIQGLEKMLGDHKSTLTKDEALRADLSSRKVAIESRKRDVEDAIMRGLSAAETAVISSQPVTPRAGQDNDPLRPDVEELTPPPMESFTPTGSPGPELPDELDVASQPVANPVEPIPAPAAYPPTMENFSPTATSIGNPNPIPVAGPGADLLNSLTQGRSEDAIGTGVNGGYTGAGAPGSFKKRKMSRSTAEDEYAAFEGDQELAGLDADVMGMLEGRG